MRNRNLEELKELNGKLYNKIIPHLHHFTDEKGVILPREKSEWALCGVRELFITELQGSETRLSYREEIRLGLGVIEKGLYILGREHLLAYTLFYLVYGTENRHNRTLYRIFSKEPNYRRLPNYENLIKDIGDDILKTVFNRESKEEIDHLITSTKNFAKKVKAKDNIELYSDLPATIPPYVEDESISELVGNYCRILSKVGNTKEKWKKEFGDELYGELYYCFKRATEILPKLDKIITTELPPVFATGGNTNNSATDTSNNGRKNLCTEWLLYPDDYTLFISRLRKAYFLVRERRNDNTEIPKV